MKSLVIPASKFFTRPSKKLSDARDKAVDKLDIFDESPVVVTIPIALKQFRWMDDFQTYLSIDRIKFYEDNPKALPPDDPDDEFGTKYPRILLIGSEYFIHDGHHRIAAALNRGDKKIKVRLWRLNSDGSSKKRVKEILRKFNKKSDPDNYVYSMSAVRSRFQRGYVDAYVFIPNTAVIRRVTPSTFKKVAVEFKKWNS